MQESGLTDFTMSRITYKPLAVIFPAECLAPFEEVGRDAGLGAQEVMNLAMRVGLPIVKAKLRELVAAPTPEVLAAIQLPKTQ